jgi:hypothetical protein
MHSMILSTLQYVVTSKLHRFDALFIPDLGAMPAVVPKPEV